MDKEDKHCLNEKADEGEKHGDTTNSDAVIELDNKPSSEDKEGQGPDLPIEEPKPHGDGKADLPKIFQNEEETSPDKDMKHSYSDCNVTNSEIPKPEQVPQRAESHRGAHSHQSTSTKLKSVVDCNVSPSTSRQAQRADIPTVNFDRIKAILDACAFDPHQMHKIQETPVLICGVGSLGTLILMQLIKVGFKNFLLLDPQPVTTNDITNSPLLPRDAHVGDSRAATTASRALCLADNLQLAFDNDPTNIKTPEFFAGFGMVIVTDAQQTELMRINLICHTNGVKYISADIFGTYGYCFVDYEHLKLPQKIYIPGEITHCHVVKYPTFGRVFEFATNRGWLSASGCGAAMCRVLLAFWKNNQRKPNKLEDIPLLKQLQDEIYHENLIPTSFFMKLIEKTSMDVAKNIAALVSVLSVSGVLCINEKMGNLFFVHPLSGSLQKEKIHVTDIVAKDHLYH